LNRHLDDLPLCGVRNRLSEKWQKWRRRRPYALGVLALAGAVLVAAGLSVRYAVVQSRQARAALEEGQPHLQQRQYALAATALKRGLSLAEGSLAGEIRDLLGQTERQRAADELHQFVEQVRVLCGAEMLALGEARSAESLCRRTWETRERIARELAPLPDADQGQVRADLLDLAILWGGLRVGLARPGQAAATHRQALDVL